MLRRIVKILVAMGVMGATILGGVVAGHESVASAHANRSHHVASPRLGRPSHVVVAAVAAATAVVPPANPAKSLRPSPNFTGNGSCAYSALDNSQACTTAVTQAINNARLSLESMMPLSFNMNAFEAMSVAQQLFVITDLERTDRALPPIVGLTTQLDNAAQTGANNNTDPTLSASALTGGARVTSWGSLWAGGTSNPLGSDYYWMYDDGYSSPNASCTTSTPQSCWGHRDQILGSFSSSASCFGSSGSEQYMGAGSTTSSSPYGPSFTEILVGACGPAPTDVVFTWTQAQQLLGVQGAPTVTAVSPSTGATAGGTSVTITGTNFTGATAVSFGSAPAASFTTTGATSLTATTPAHAAGTVDVTVTGPNGPSGVVAPDHFTFVVPSTPDFSLSLSPPSQDVTVGSAAAFVVSLGALNGDTSAVTLSVSGAPAGTTFSPTTPTWSGGTAMSTMRVPAETTAGSFTMTITAMDGAGRTHSAPATLTVASKLQGTANITGSVYSAGVYVSGATVTASRNGIPVTATTTGSTGTFAITGLTQGTYTLVVAAPGYTSTTVSVTVFNGNWTRLNVVLERSAVPAVTAVTPVAGPLSGGTTVVITGANFSGVTALRFGSSPATSYSLISSSSISAVSPAAPAGTVDIVVVGTGGTSAVGNADHFTYAPRPAVSSVTPASGPASGGTPVTITGSGFTGATIVRFGSVSAPSFTVNGAGSITALSPQHAEGSVDVTVTAPGGTSAIASSDPYTFTPASPDFSLAVGPSSQSVVAGTAAVFTVSLGAQNGDTSPVTLSVSGAPSGTAFSSNTPTWSAGVATSTMTIPASAPVGSYAMTITAADTAGRVHSVTAGLTVVSPLAGNANITGSVYAAGVTLPGATVTVLQNGTVLTSTTTNSAGAFTITGLTQGTYTLVGSAPGYASTTLSTTVFSNNWTKVSLTLSR